MDADKVNAALEARQKHPVTINDLSLMQTSSMQGSAAGRAFTITATAQVKKAAFSRTAVIRITGDAHRPYGILDWGVGQ